ncbi:hypothetical protein PQ465_10755 [Sphingobacterium oryzagri]|uniref:Uncharacterized protein n=1 Tax=Sphingobacterium oryzagri TaxID=3025669 RepID=A0ABY7WAX0_9SPHI|nr:hypothetical protein [Sphingobacterium sp. KACC 22765]WDF66783.1 hypothetical protein PQ465_10755 [Sphingobacterium sp. KACC 22765]
MVQTNENKDRSDAEKGVAENEKANYTRTENDADENSQTNEDPSIKETNDPDKKEDTGGDLAGNASGNTDAD